MGLVFVDCEAKGPCPSLGRLTEFGAVNFSDRQTFHGRIIPSRPSLENPAISEPLIECSDEEYVDRMAPVFVDFGAWLKQVSKKSRPIFVSDNVAFDWQWINDGFWRICGHNPFGHSGRRISDFYAGLRGDFSKTQEWKRLRVTPHTHNPVDDAMGNVEAFARLLEGER